MSRSRRSSRILPFALSLLGLAGCQNEGLNVPEYVSSLTTQICQAVVTCNCEYENGGLYDHCVAQLSVVFESQAELNLVDGLVFDGECAEKSLEELSALACGVPVGNPDAACEVPCKIWHGPMGKGGSCEYVNSFDNCEQGLVCGSDSVCIDPCDEPNLPTIGEACAPSIGCVDAAYCDNESDPVYPICVGLPNVGQPCAELFGNYLCAEDLVCDFSDDPVNPVCAALPGSGEECLDGDCADGLFCDFQESPAVCTPLPTLGQDCPFAVCAAPYWCGPDDVCVDPPPAVCTYYGGLPALGCDDNEFTCGDDSCIAGSLVCDGNFDCGDGSDEDPLICSGGGCGVDEFECLDGACIPGVALCDGAVDCVGGEDENPDICGGGNCGVDEYQCLDGACIPASWECDGITDCNNGEDEASC